MIDQDYAELLGRSPPTGDLLEWTFPASALANAFVSLLIGTPAMCLALYVAGGEGDHVHGSVEFRVPTLTRLSIRDNPIGEVFTAGMHLAAAMAIPLFWCVKLSHHQRLQARTGVTRYDLQAEDAVWWVKTAWVVGTLGATLLFAAASVPGDKKGSSSSAQSVLHLVLSLLAACGLIGQTACTAWALRKARRVFVVSEADLMAYRRKVFLASVAVVAALVAVCSVLMVECFADGACGVGYLKGNAAGSFDFGGGGFDGSLFLDKGGVPNFRDDDVSVGGGGGGGGGSKSVHGDLYEEEASLMIPGGVDGSVAGEESTGVSAVTAIAAPAEAVPTEADPIEVAAPGNGTSHRRDCNTEWCYSRSLMGLWEWLLLLLEGGFCIALRHDLAPATAGVGVESFVL
eukprot:g9043.t1